jgi:hypothetical protein
LRQAGAEMDHWQPNPYAQPFIPKRAYGGHYLHPGGHYVPHGVPSRRRFVTKMFQVRFLPLLYNLSVVTKLSGEVQVVFLAPVVNHER